MKMPEKHDLFNPPFSRQRNKASGQSLRLQWHCLRGEYNGGAFTKAVIDAMCAIIA